MEEKYIHNKLIRDKIPEIIEANGGTYEIKTLSDEEFDIELRKKGIEEAQEIVETPDEKLLGELADQLQVIKSIGELHGIGFEEVEKARKEKLEKRGGFKKKIFLVSSSQPAGK